MTMGYTRSPQVDSRPFWGGSTFSDPPSFRRETGLQPPHPARSLPWHRRRRTTHAPASRSADPWAGAVADAAHSARFPAPSARCRRGCARQQGAALAHSRAPPGTAKRVAALPRPRVSGTRKLACAPSTIGWIADRLRQGARRAERMCEPQGLPTRRCASVANVTPEAIVTSRQPSPPLGGDQVACAGRHERHQRPHLGR